MIWSLFLNGQTSPCVCHGSVVLTRLVSLLVQEFPLFGRRTECGPQRTGSRLRYRHCGRRRCERLGAAAQALRGHDPHLDFRWGLGSLRAHCSPHPVHKIKTTTCAKPRPPSSPKEKCLYEKICRLSCCWRKKVSNGGKWKKNSATGDARSDGRGGGVIKQRHIKKIV